MNIVYLVNGCGSVLVIKVPRTNGAEAFKNLKVYAVLSICSRYKQDSHFPRILMLNVIYPHSVSCIFHYTYVRATSSSFTFDPGGMKYFHFSCALVTDTFPEHETYTYKYCFGVYIHFGHFLKSLSIPPVSKNGNKSNFLRNTRFE